MKTSTITKLILGLVLAFAVVSVLLLATRKGSSPTSSQSTGTNSYPLLLEAASEIQDLPPDNYRKDKDREMLQQVLHSNSQVLLTLALTKCGMANRPPAGRTSYQLFCRRSPALASRRRMKGKRSRSLSRKPPE
jgi:hypothetical protein